MVSSTTSLAGTVRTLLRFGGARYGGLPGIPVISCWATLSERSRRKLTLGTVSPKTSPCRRPQAAAGGDCRHGVARVGEGGDEPFGLFLEERCDRAAGLGRQLDSGARGLADDV